MQPPSYKPQEKQHELISFAHQQTPQHPIFQLYQLTHQFHQEARHRQAWEAHCGWYQATSEEHQREIV